MYPFNRATTSTSAIAAGLTIYKRGFHCVGGSYQYLKRPGYIVSQNSPPQTKARSDWKQQILGIVAGEWRENNDPVLTMLFVNQLDFECELF